MKLGVHRPRPWPHCARWGPSPHPERDRATPNFRPICGGQMAAWIKMPLGMEVGLDPDDCVRWEPRPLPQKGAELKGAEPAQIFGPFIVAKRLDGSRWHLAWR